MKYPELVINNYDLLDKIYGNYISFQCKLAEDLKNYSESENVLNILEIGCGSGITSKIILNSRKDCSVTSIDNDSNMVKITKNLRSNYKNLKVKKKDALSYMKSSKNNSFDAVVSAFTIHNFRKDYRSKFYKELYRILKKDGIFLNADKFVSDNLNMQIQSFKYRMGRYFDVLIRMNQYEILDYWIRDYVKDQKPEFIMKYNKEKKVLQDLNFKQVHYIFKSEREMLGIIKVKK